MCGLHSVFVVSLSAKVTPNICLLPPRKRTDALARREKTRRRRRKWERTRDETERWPEKTCGSLHRCPKRSHLSFSGPLRQGRRANCGSADRPLSGCRQKWRRELLMEAEVSYRWLRVWTATRCGGLGLSRPQQLAAALINTLLFTHWAGSH